jgi:TPR repeat protein
VGRLEEARSTLESALKRETPDAKELYFNLGLVQMGLEDPEAAFDAFRAAANLGHPGAMNNLGFLYEAAGDLEEALRAHDFAAASGDPEAAPAARQAAAAIRAGLQSSD